MIAELTLRITLTDPFPGVVYGLQEGKGNDFSTIQKQEGDGHDLVFEFRAKYKIEAGSVVLLGPFAQGTPQDRFTYLDIGTIAGQTDSVWSRRLKIPLTGITEQMIRQLEKEKDSLLSTTVPGKGKDGGPNCATVKPFEGWAVALG